MTTCISCTHATTRTPAGGPSAHRKEMWKLGFVGCFLESSEANSYPADTDLACKKWVAASHEQMEKRKGAKK